MHDDIYYEYALAMTTKTWALKPDLDKLILEIVQSGIQQYWENQVINQLNISDTLHILYSILGGNEIFGYKSAVSC